MATYYIDPVNGSDTYNATQAQNTATPWKTWAKTNASGSWVGGNSFLQKAGTTSNATATFANGGSSDSSRITFGRYGDGPNPIIDGTGLQFGIRWYSGSSWITIQDFTVLNMSGHASGMTAIGGGGGADCDGVVIRRCTISGVASNGLVDCNGIYIKGNYAVVEDCDISNIADDGIWIQSTTQGPHIINCRIVSVAEAGRPTGDCIQLYGASNGFLVSRCYLDHQNSAVKQAFIVSGATSATQGGRVEDNFIKFPADTTGGTSAVFSDQPGVIIQRNTIIGGRSGVTLDTGAGQIVRHNTVSGAHYGLLTTADPTGMLIDKNTFVDCTAGGPYLPSDDATSYVRNNVFLRCVRGLATHGSINKSKNCYYGNSDYNWASIAGGGIIEGDALLSDPRLSISYRPLPGSPLIGAGTHLGYTRDLAGAQRPNPPSIGAYDVARLRNVHA